MNNTTKRSLMTSITALILCFAMLLGTTFAWFTDTASSSGNVIQAGNLEIALMKGTPNESGNWTWVENNGEAIFDYDKWEPGYTTWAALAVENHGSLAAKWQAQLVLNGTPSILADVIEVYSTYDHVFNPDARPDFEDGNWRKMGTVSELIANGGMLMSGDLIEPGHRQPVVIALHMREDAGNEYQGLDLGANFDIKVIATQASFEDDSFGNDYDADAEWPEIETGYYASTIIDSSNLMLGALTSEVTIGGNGVGATIPADVKVADGATSLDLSMKKVDNGNLNLGDGESATSFDVHIEGIAQDNTQPMIVNLGAVLPTGLTDTELKLYHTENGTPVQMTRVASANDFAIHNQYTYNEQTGEVSIYVASFSVFTAVSTSADKWIDTTVADTSWYNDDATEFVLADVADFLGFRDLVDKGTTFAGKTVKLGADIDLNGKLFNPIGGGWSYLGSTTTFNGTFDGQHHTIYNIYVNGWELDEVGDQHSGTSKGAGLFSSIHNATIKNLVVNNAEMVVETTSIGIIAGCAEGVCTFENIVVTNANLGNYQMRNGGIVGDIYITDADAETDRIDDKYTHVFKDITVDSTVKLSSMWGDFDTGNGGVVGGRYGDTQILMQNVIVACELDVFSDVTAAYQWYAYRRCGMLVGYTGQNSPKKATNASADFLTCENVNVYYGDWVNYTYYQFTNQSVAWQNNYPWVRAQGSNYNGILSNVRYGNPVINSEKINTIELAEANKTDFVKITFNQLYGGGQGVYGTASHDCGGVTVRKISELATTTVQFQNIENWDNVKIEYFFTHGENTWSTLVEGLSATSVTSDGTFDVYAFSIPSIAYSFKITGTKNSSAVSTNDYLMSNVKANEIYSLNGLDLVETTKITFTPNTAWKNGGGRYAVYAFNSSHIWYNLNAEGNSYVCYLPVNYNKVIFCRMNSAYNTNAWDNESYDYVWSQTGNNLIPESDITDGEYSYTVGDYLYFNPTDGWKASNARFAAYFFNDSGNTWVSLTDSDGDGIFEVKVPSGYSKVIFCRMNPSYSINSWNPDNSSIKYVWNQTGDLIFNTSSYEIFYAVPEDSQWNKPTTGWYGL